MLIDLVPGVGATPTPDNQFAINVKESFLLLSLQVIRRNEDCLSVYRSPLGIGNDIPNRGGLEQQ